MTISPEHRRAAEERVFARYEADLLSTAVLSEVIARSPARKDYEPVWPLPEGRIRVTELMIGIFVEEVRLERSYPDTSLYFTFRHWRRPACLFATDRLIWSLETLGKPEPQFNDLLMVHLMEDISTRFGRELDNCNPDEVSDFARHGLWSISLSRIASGEIPTSPRDQELAARALEQIEGERLRG